MMETATLMAHSAVLGSAQREYAAGTTQASAEVKSGGEAGQRLDQGKASARDVNAVVDQLKSFVKEAQRNLDFSVDDSSGQFVVKVMDGDSGKMIRQIPSEELLRLSEQLENMRSLLFKAEA